MSNVYLGTCIVIYINILYAYAREGYIHPNPRCITSKTTDAFEIDCTSELKTVSHS